MQTLAFFQNLGMTEMLILAFLGLLIFGKKLPEVGKSLGQGIVQFKKGLQGVESQIEDVTNIPDAPKKKKKKKALEGEPVAAVDTNVASGGPAIVVEKPAE